MPSPTDRFIESFESGRRLKLLEEEKARQQELEEEERKLRKAMLQKELRDMKILEQMEKFKLMTQEAEAQVSRRTGQPDIRAMLEQMPVMTHGMPIAGGEAPVGALSRHPATIPPASVTNPPVQFPGLNIEPQPAIPTGIEGIEIPGTAGLNIPGRTVTPPTFQDLVRQKLMERELASVGEAPKLQGFAPGTTVFREGEPYYQVPEKAASENMYSLAMKAAQGDETAIAALDRIKAVRATPTSSAAQDRMVQAELIAEAIINGDQPPELTRLYGLAGPVRAALAQRKFDLSQMEADWQAMKRHLASMNSQTQLRLRQAVDISHHALQEIIKPLMEEWFALGLQSGFRDVNTITIEAAKRLPGRPGEIAQRLQTQINDFIAEISVVYRGGGTPTDHTMQLAAENLKGNWNMGTMRGAVGDLDKTLRIRWASIKNIPPVGMTGIGQEQYWGGRTTEPEIEKQRLDYTQMSIEELIDRARNKNDREAYLELKRRQP